MFSVVRQYSLIALKMVALLFFLLMGVFVGRTISGTVPQDFKSIHDEPPHLEAVFTNNGTNESNPTHDNSELHNVSSSVLVDFENLNASHVLITELHNTSDLNHSKNVIPEEDHVVKKISKGSGHSKKKVSKESSRFKKKFSEESNHDDRNNLKSVSTGDHADDFHHSVNNVSKTLDHTKDMTNNHSDSRSDHSEDFSIKSDLLNKVSKSSAHDVNTAKEELATKALDDQDVKIVREELLTDALEDRSENAANDLNHFDLGHLNDSAIAHSSELTENLNEVAENVSKELNSTWKITSELENNTQISSGSLNASDHFDHTENVHNASRPLNPIAALSNSKLFLNIHNTFMKLNTADKSDSTRLNHIGRTSSEQSNHMRLDTPKTNEIFKKPSEAVTSSGKFSSPEIHPDMLSNITPKNEFINISISDSKDNKNNADILVTVAPNESDINFSSELSGEQFKDFKVNINKSEIINNENNESIATKNNETQGLFSKLGLDFLMNSELAKNAASAMEIFNLSDSALTDHIVDDKNDMHDFLDFTPLVDIQNHSKSDHSPETVSTLDIKSFILDAENSTFEAESSAQDSKSSAFVDVDEKILLTLDERIENKNDPISDSSILPFSKNLSIEVLTTTISNPILNSTVEYEVITMPAQLNSTVEYEVTTMPAQLNNSTVEYEDTAKLSQPMRRNGTELGDEAKCPPPGLCIFWFLGQDTCTLNSHCLGSRICCRIGCTKTCIEI